MSVASGDPSTVEAKDAPDAASAVATPEAEDHADDDLDAEDEADQGDARDEEDDDELEFVDEPPPAPREGPPAEPPARGAPAKGRTASSFRPVDERVLFLEELSWKQLDAVDRDRTAIFLVVAPLDQHGPHLPIGVDCFSAQAFAASAARRLATENPEWTAILSPVIPLGAQTFDYLGSVPVRRRAVRDLVEDYGASFAAYDFRNIVVVTAHGAPGHLMALDEAASRVNARYGSRMVSPMGRVLGRLLANAHRDTLRKLLSRNGNDLDFSTDQHAGHLETSLMLYLRPELVDPGYSRLKPVMVPADRIDENAARELGDRLGYFGTPSAADRELGRVVVNLVGKEIAELVLQVHRDPGLLEEFEPPLFDPMVVYRTDFLRWCLAALVLVAAIPTWILFFR